MLQIILEAVDKPRVITFKGATDLVTETDKASEDAILAVRSPGPRCARGPHGAARRLAATFPPWHQLLTCQLRAIIVFSYLGITFSDRSMTDPLRFA